MLKVNDLSFAAILKQTSPGFQQQTKVPCWGLKLKPALKCDMVSFESAKNFKFSSESVTEGHPDKICDIISDSIVDRYLTEDPNARVAANVTVSKGKVDVIGQVTSKANVDIVNLVRETIKQIGYIPNYVEGFDADTCQITTNITSQSSDIKSAVDVALEVRKSQKENEFSKVGAGDQGLMFGFACDETPELMPLPIHLSHKLAAKLTEVRKNGTLPYLRPDGKSQVTVEYKDGVPSRIDSVVISTQHAPEINGETDNNKVQAKIREDLIKYVANEVFKDEKIKPDENTTYFINPSGRFVIGGPLGDSGLTGRKIIVDTYGGYARHGGGAFSGKDPTKMDRSAAYAARHIAKNIVAAGLAKKCEVQVGYAIGVARPVSIMVDTFDTGVISDEEIAKLVEKDFDLRPAAIISNFDLKNLPAKCDGSFYRKLAVNGHLGRTDVDTPWEHTDKVDLLKQDLSKIKQESSNKLFFLKWLESIKGFGVSILAKFGIIRSPH